MWQTIWLVATSCNLIFKIRKCNTRDIRKCNSASNYILIIWERYLLKRGMTWNNLKRPTTSKKRPEMTYNEQETTWSNLKQAVNELKWPMTSKAQPTTTWIYQQWIKEDPKWPTTSRFWDYFTIRCNWFSSLTHFPAHL